MKTEKTGFDLIRDEVERLNNDAYGSSQIDPETIMMSVKDSLSRSGSEIRLEESLDGALAATVISLTRDAIRADLTHRISTLIIGNPKY